MESYKSLSILISDTDRLRSKELAQVAYQSDSKQQQQKIFTNKDQRPPRNAPDSNSLSYFNISPLSGLPVAKAQAL